MTTHLPEFEIALAGNDYSAIERIWLEQVESRPLETDLFLELAEKLAERNELKRVAALLSLCLDPLKTAKAWESAYRIALEIARYNPNEKGLWNELLEIIPEVFTDFPEIDVLLAEGQEKHPQQVKAFLEFLKVNTYFRPGDYVNHSTGWGIGLITDVSPSRGKLTVDFETKKGHEFQIQAARKLLQRLAPDHLEVWKQTRPQDLRDLALSDPDRVLRMAIAAEGRREQKITQRDLKTRLVPQVLEGKTWTKFLGVLKKAVQVDDYIHISRGSNPTYKILDAPVTHATKATERFNRVDAWNDRLQRARQTFQEVKEHNHDPAPLQEMADWFEKLLSEDSERRDAADFGAVCFLKELRKAFPTLEVAEPPKLKPFFKPADPDAFVALLAYVPIPKYQKEGLDIVRKHYPEAMFQVLLQSFLTPAPALWDEALKIAEADGHIQAYHEAGETLSADPTRNPEGFCWYIRQQFKRLEVDPEQGVEDDNGRELTRLFEKAITLANQMGSNLQKGDKNARGYLTKVKGILSEKRAALLQTILPALDEDRASHLYHQVGRATHLGDNLMRKLRKEIRHAFPNVEAPTAAEAAAEKPMFESDKVIYTTASGLEKRRAELDFLVRDKMPDIQKAIGHALEMGDISENAELEAAREEEVRVKTMIGEISGDLEKASVINPASVDSARVGFGVLVEVRDEDSQEEERWTILGPWDIDIKQGIISYLSPIAKALWGAEPDQLVDLKAEGRSKARRLTVLSIKNALAEEEAESRS